MSSDRFLDGWYFKNEGETVGPVSAADLRELLRAGRVQPRQAVWQRRPEAAFFVHASTAANPDEVPENTWRNAS